MATKALFLDRDGVINVDHGYVYRICNFDFIDDIFDLALTAQKLGYIIIVITNQSGIARGFYSEEDFHALSDWMCNQFKARGIVISSVYYSPYHPTAGVGRYLRDDVSRKPNPGMILDAAEKFSIDLEHSVLVGDSVSDIEAGVSAGVYQNILYCPGVVSEKTPFEIVCVSSLRDVVRFLSP